MIKRLSLSIAAIALAAHIAQAGSYEIAWQASAKAETYRLWVSTDDARTWQKVYEGTETRTTVSVDGNAVFLYSVEAVNGSVSNARRDVGAWIIPSLSAYNGQITINPK